jgi:hypothetical protein
VAQNASDDGTRRGWLLQAFDGLSRVWPHAEHRLVNSALMATGPSGFEGCLNTFVPLDADVALLGFADICSRRTSLPLYNSTFGLALESIVRELAGRPDPPAIVFFNVHKFVAWECTLAGGLCAFWMTCEAQMQELAQFYAASVVSVTAAIDRPRGMAVPRRHHLRTTLTHHTWPSLSVTICAALSQPPPSPSTRGSRAHGVADAQRHVPPWRDALRRRARLSSQLWQVDQRQRRPLRPSPRRPVRASTRRTMPNRAETACVE